MPPAVVEQSPLKTWLVAINWLLLPSSEATASAAVGQPDVPDWRVAAVVQFAAAVDGILCTSKRRYPASHTWCSSLQLGGCIPNVDLGAVIWVLRCLQRAREAMAYCWPVDRVNTWIAMWQVACMDDVP